MSSIEIAFKIIELSLTAVGLLIAFFGFVLPYHQSLRQAEERRKEESERKRSEDLQRKEALESEKRRWRKELIDKQISQLYGPIYSIIQEGRVQWELLKYQLGRDYIFKSDETLVDLPENEQKIWKHYVDTYKIKQQMEIVDILEKNIHLIYKSEIQSCYWDFMDYSLGFELLDNQKRCGVPNYYDYHYSTNYPKQFDKYIEDTLKLLLKEQENLIAAEA